MTTDTRPDDVQQHADFSPAERDAVYRCIETRRDVRGQFLPDPIPDDVLARLLHAAHHAPSVGFMQPWDFIVVRDPAAKQRVHTAFAAAHKEASQMFPDEKAARYRALKLEGILEAPVGLCITCDRERTGPVVIGRTHQPEMDLYSAVCAVQTLWLAARAENLGVGWVSIVRYEDLRTALGIPPRIQPIAYLCIGRVSHFYAKPELETAGWLPRLPLRDLVWFDAWHHRDGDESLLSAL
ncbi:Cobalamin biosynthesis protein BluB [Rhodovulum sp. PH10]|uniref:5,6-dimethylbenzimidazole synthase n=1 Tax=Rhodovulum sp. PH10 TaxID=1187851 RepID=UPI00027C27A9|nr:5,6-dimethylbenzimidazole synthase [Rhodovulum sp. PH10]EJW11783.1 Cobalamin biosynthesis protein BluB [Rhodovulum sp. PH10]